MTHQLQLHSQYLQVLLEDRGLQVAKNISDILIHLYSTLLCDFHFSSSICHWTVSRPQMHKKPLLEREAILRKKAFMPVSVALSTSPTLAFTAHVGFSGFSYIGSAQCWHYMLCASRCLFCRKLMRSSLRPNMTGPSSSKDIFSAV